MPVTRSSNTVPHPQLFPTPSPPSKRRGTSHNSDAISLTSSDTESPKAPVRKPQQIKIQPPARSQRAAFVPPPDEEIIEISSDEDSPRRPVQPSVIADYRREISRLREESVKHKKNWEKTSKELKLAKEENQKLQAVDKIGKGKTLNADALSDQLDCEICTMKMWTPYILPDCGHSFCQSCLQDWFSATQAQFLATHPENPNHNYALLAMIDQMTQQPHIATHPDILRLLEAHIPPHPVYTCPTCRETVRSRPTEDFTLKGIVHSIAETTGETPPNKNQPPSNRKGKATAVASGPWDGFFPPRKP